MLKFLTESDFAVVCDSATLSTISQASSTNIEAAELFAIEEISAYLRGRYDIAAEYDKTGTQRNNYLIMITADVALYHMVCNLPKRSGYEIRFERYQHDIDWLMQVQAGKASPNLAPLTGTDGSDIGCPVQFRSMTYKCKYDY